MSGVCVLDHRQGCSVTDRFQRAVRFPSEFESEKLRPLSAWLPSPQSDGERSSTPQRRGVCRMAVGSGMDRDGPR